MLCALFLVCCHSRSDRSTVFDLGCFETPVVAGIRSRMPSAAGNLEEAWAGLLDVRLARRAAAGMGHSENMARKGSEWSIGYEVEE